MILGKGYRFKKSALCFDKDALWVAKNNKRSQ
jgi:hypothetical protein